MIAIYESCISNLKSGDPVEDLIEQAYDDFTQRYGLKQVSEKKLLEFIASLYNTSDSRRSIAFLRFIGAGKKLNLKDYSRLTFIFYLHALDFMIHSNIGVDIGYDDTNDKTLLPTVRALDFLHNKMEYKFDKEILAKMLAKIEQISVPDPNKINISLIEMDYFLEVIIESFEEYQYKIDQGLFILIEAIKYDEEKEILLKSELNMLIRNVSPHKIKEIDENTDEVAIDVGSIYKKCVEKNLLSTNDIKLFYKNDPNLSYENVLKFIEETKDKLYEIVEKVDQADNKKYLTLTKESWKSKLNIVETNAVTRNLNQTMLAWKIFEAELTRFEEFIEKFEN